MFTGLIETKAAFISGSVSGKSGKLLVKTEKKLHGLIPGESIAVNGACLTLEREYAENMLEFHVLEESFRRTNLGFLTKGSIVNIERAMKLGERFGGHIVTGHVDGTGKILSQGMRGSDYELEISLAPELRPFFTMKGSAALDGISLTVAKLADDSFTLCIIPTTMKETNLLSKKKGDLVNIETDMIGKYVRNTIIELFGKKAASSVTLETLGQAGFFE